MLQQICKWMCKTHTFTIVRTHSLPRHPHAWFANSRALGYYHYMKIKSNENEKWLYMRLDPER